jgi:RimJ/RimL family protein N-acetyltransferase
MVDIPADDKLPRDDSVVLTFFHLSDAAALRDVDADSEHRRRFEFPEEFVPSLEHSEKVISDWTRERTGGGPFVFAVRVLADGHLLGGREIRLLGHCAANLSYFTLPQQRTRGFASRAAALVCQIAFVSLGVQHVEIVVDPDNIASRRVAIRNGFREIGVRNGRTLHRKEADLPPDICCAGAREQELSTFAQASECRSSCDLLSVLVNRKFNRAMVQSAMTTFKIIFCPVERYASSITFASNHEFRYVCSPALVDGLRKERNAYPPERSRYFRIDKAVH